MWTILVGLSFPNMDSLNSINHEWNDPLLTSVVSLRFLQWQKLLMQRNKAFLFILMKKISKWTNMMVAPVPLNYSVKTFKVNVIIYILSLLLNMFHRLLHPWEWLILNISNILRNNTNNMHCVIPHKQPRQWLSMLF